MSGLFRVLSVGLVLGFALMPSPVAAQAVTGTILGTVRDSSGGALPGANVTLLNQDTGYTRTFTADSSGEYTAPLMPTGTYTVTGEISGFKKVSLANVHLGVDQKVRADLKLDIGQMSEAVTIQAETPLIQTNSSELGTTITDTQIEALPLNGRNFVSLTRTIPGVLRPPPGANIDGAGSLAWRAGSGFSANGQRARDNNYLLDGVDNNETWLQTVVIFPSVDALDEFKIQTSTYSAEFGKSLGGVVNIQIKSGGNQFRGNVFDFERNDALDANNFFNNRAGRAKPDFKQHQFGATLGGPIVKDRTFFFADYQGLRINQGQTYVSTVPSAAMRAGNFSEINRVIYDPLTGQPFPGNIIPTGRFDPVSKNIINMLYPEPNATGTKATNGQTLGNYVINPVLQRQDNQFDVKLDHNVSATNHAFARYSFQKTHRLLPATLPHGDAGATFGAGDGNIKAQSATFNDTHSFSNSFLNEFRFGWNSIKFFMTPIDYLQNPAAAVGLTGINLNDSTSGMTQLNFQNIRNLGANSNQPLITNQNDFQLFDSVTRVSGKHTMKAGGSITLRSREILNADTIVGQFVFDNNPTSNCGGKLTGCSVVSTTGFDVASFLLGYASQKNRNLFDAKTYTEKRPEYALYVQDDVRASNKLTLNMGLRWDLFVPWVEVDNRQSNFDVTTGRFVVAAPDAVMGGVTVGRYLQTYAKKDFGPRFGFAYDVTGSGKTVLRGGVGVFWNFTPGGTSSSKAQNPPFLQSTALRNSAFGTNLKVSDGLPPPTGVNPNLLPAGSTRSTFDRDFRDAYSTNFNVNVQQQLGRNYMLEVSYVGSRARQMLLKTNENQAPPVLGVTNANVNRPFIALDPALGDLGTVTSTGFLNYNGLLVKFQRRFANGFSFMNSYTYGLVTDLSSDNDGGVALVNTYDPGYNRGPADYDVKHTFVSNFVYALPFGKASKIGGWQVAGILYARTGRALNITQSQAVLSTGTNSGQQASQRPNRLADNIKNPDQTIDHWFDPAAFQIVPETTATFGTAGRNIARGPGYFNIDLNLIKVTKFGRFEHELRAEVFNVLNHPAFADPNTTFGNSAFGTITAMLANPACALCGTTERQIQLSMKLKF
ncbi:MAG TPA: carboxypeptidase-like regulatory domain-containing protein [Vicinamibacteria bacterium]|nr:carboxypeptidase-like regulatory domain-containing protein [Vicinamibacteria bacterium]